MRHTASMFALLVAVLQAAAPAAPAASAAPQAGTQAAAPALTPAANQAAKPAAQTAAQPAAKPAARPAPSPASPQVYFIWPYDGTVINGGKFWLRMGLRNMGVAPKGANVPHTGHHHVLIDTELPPMTEPIPNDRNHLHFGAGETEARIELPPGTHTLQLLLGDKDHVPHTPPVVSKKITITVR